MLNEGGLRGGLKPQLVLLPRETNQLPTGSFPWFMLNHLIKSPIKDLLMLMDRKINRESRFETLNHESRKQMKK